MFWKLVLMLPGEEQSAGHPGRSGGPWESSTADVRVLQGSQDGVLCGVHSPLRGHFGYCISALGSRLVNAAAIVARGGWTQEQLGEMWSLGPLTFLLLTGQYIFCFLIMRVGLGATLGYLRGWVFLLVFRKPCVVPGPSQGRQESLALYCLSCSSPFFPQEILWVFKKEIQRMDTMS